MRSPAALAVVARGPGTCDPAHAAHALGRVARRIAPLWPLRRFVAVNPYLGLLEHRFGEAAAALRAAAGARSVMPRVFYARAIADGRIGDADLAAALAHAPAHPALPRDVGTLKALAAAPQPESPRRLTPTVADVARTCTGEDWPRLVAERIGAFAAAHFDQGQAAWPSPWRGQAPFAAWREQARLDRTPELLGIEGFRARVAALPEQPVQAAAAILERLGVPPTGVDAYLHRLLMSIAGWAGHARWRGWDPEAADGGDPLEVVGLLVVRLAFEDALLAGLPVRRLEKAWTLARERIVAPGSDDSLALDLVLQDAYEKAWQRELAARFAAARTQPRRRGEQDDMPRAPLQAAFCIDVRSEPMRRALEAVVPGADTIGFAGFFGLAMDYRRFASSGAPEARCPVLLAPKLRIRETVRGATEAQRRALAALRRARLRAATAWRSFKLAAVSCFAFVETLGPLYAIRLVTDGLGLTRPAPRPDAFGLGAAARAHLGPELDPRGHGHEATGIAAEDRLALAEAILRGMSLTRSFARLVLLAGHSASTVNNPHAAALDCGACGGHDGGPSARLAAAVLNDPGVRAGLARRGIRVPPDTLFLAALHDTTTDAVRILERHAVPSSHRGDLAWLEARLAEAAHAARTERASRLGIAPGQDTERTFLRRARDWSQPRPEWGLAGCAAFIAAPRARTRGLDLGGRAFLHSYDWREDRDFAVLELIMTAPMVVASWISLQYYASTVDPQVFGSGDKTLHNVTGTIGVVEGNGGDLRSGLPWQSVHDGERPAHEPLRLTVLIEAPAEAMNAIIARHEPVRRLLDNGWLHLLALGEDGTPCARYAGGLQWQPAGSAEAAHAGRDAAP